MSRKLSECVKDGEPIKHTIQSKTWIVTYNKNNDTLVCGDLVYSGKSPLNRFTVSNYKKYRPNRSYKNNAWTECKIYRNNIWISMENLPQL
tara:strand:+ start:1356 stop:1628 length:273 start_codon:yes stop_codon:yes gene_type:complete